jgi:DNA-binding PadR family transcriptional regulator
MVQDDACEEAKPRERTPLRTAVLAALLQHNEGYGYDIADRLGRIWPMWDVKRNRTRVHRTLEEFEEDGLATSDYERGPGKRGHLRRVYRPTPVAEQLRSIWVGEHPPLEQMRSDIRTWVAFARPQDAPELLRKLDEYRLDCLEVLQAAERLEDEPAGWYDRAINMLRYGMAEELRAELNWITRVRREVKGFLTQ